MFARKRKSPTRQIADQGSKRVYSYYSNNVRRRAEEQPDRSRQSSQRATKPNSPKWWHNLPAIIALGVIMVCVGYILSVNTNPKVVQVTGSQDLFLRDNNSYQEAANNIINKSLFNFNKVTFNVGVVSQDLRSQFPELSDASISLPIINRRPVIYIRASQPALVLITEDRSMVVDNRGMAVLPTSQVPNLTTYRLATVLDKSGLSPTAGKQVLPAKDVRFILDTLMQFKLANKPVDQLTLPANANQLVVNLKSQPYIIKMDLQGNSREQVGAYLAAQSKINNTKSGTLQYIDVRVPGRVYYK